MLFGISGFGLSRGIAAISPLFVIDAFERFLLENTKRIEKFVCGFNPEVLEVISRRRAVDVFRFALENVPAYKDFLRVSFGKGRRGRRRTRGRRGVKQSEVGNFRQFKKFVPVTTKENYVLKYSYDKRCVGGRLPLEGNIDESSGSTGKPTNWVHGISEEDNLFKLCKFEFDYLFGDKEYIVINAWSTGPWATGIKFSEIAERCALVKNTSTDKDKIVETLRDFGPGRHYLIAGYPPFLQQLFEDKRIKWSRYKINVLTGGEGIIPEWKGLIRKRIGKNAVIVSAYGASDIDVGIGVETPLTEVIRQKIAKNKGLFRKVCGDAVEVPMVFQYNPLVHFIEEVRNKNGKVELVFTLLDKNAACPKIRYNLRDEGRVFSFARLFRILKRDDRIRKEFLDKRSLRLPFIFVFGRSDGTISIDGANIYPDQVERCIAMNKKLFSLTENFMISKGYGKKKVPVFVVYIRLKKGKKPYKGLQREYERAINEGLCKLNWDYKEVFMNNKYSAETRVRILKYNNKIFSKDEGKIKERYIF